MRLPKSHLTTFTSPVDEDTELNYLYLPSKCPGYGPLPWQQFTWYIPAAHVEQVMHVFIAIRTYSVSTSCETRALLPVCECGTRSGFSHVD